jgi:hypothetical protein
MDFYYVAYSRRLLVKENVKKITTGTLALLSAFIFYFLFFLFLLIPLTV